MKDDKVTGNVILYTDVNYQGTTLEVAPHDNIQIATDSTWEYRSARLNGNEVFVSAPQETLSPPIPGVLDLYQEFYTTDDIPDFASFITFIDPTHECYIMPLVADDIVVSMNVDQHSQRGYLCGLSAAATEPDNMQMAAYDFDQESKTGTLAILNRTNLLSTVISSYIYMHPMPIPTPQRSMPDQYTLTSGLKEIIGASFLTSVSYNNDTVTVSSEPYDNDGTSYSWGAVTKITENNFMVDFLITLPTPYCVVYKDPNYQGYASEWDNDTWFLMSSPTGEWYLKSIEIDPEQILDSKVIAWTEFSFDDLAYNFNNYSVSTYLNSNVADITTEFSSFTKDINALVFNSGVSPVYLRITNTSNPTAWQDLIISSQYNHEGIEGAKINFYCTGNPDVSLPIMSTFDKGLENPIAPGVLGSVVILRYGQLNSDGTAQWLGQTEVTFTYNTHTGIMTAELSSSRPYSFNVNSLINNSDGSYTLELEGCVCAC